MIAVRKSLMSFICLLTSGFTRMNKNLYKGIFFSMFGIIGVITIVLSVFLSGTIPWHNGILRHMESRFLSIDHPVESSFIERYSYLGTIYESGNSGCYFYVGEIRETTLPKEELAQIYEQVKVTLFGYSEVFAVRVAFAEDWPSLIMDQPIYEWLEKHQESDINTADLVYVVYITRNDRSWFGDYRCWD